MTPDALYSALTRVYTSLWGIECEVRVAASFSVYLMHPIMHCENIVSV